MESKKQTKVINSNRADFYRQVTSHQIRSVSELVDVTALGSNQIIIIDSCGWHYKTCFPQQSIIALENIKTVLEYQLPRDKFDKLFDGITDNDPCWPKLHIDSPSVVFDNAPILKYKTLPDLMNILQSVADAYKPVILVVQHNLTLVDDYRLTDRLHNIASIKLNGYIIEKFYYDLKRTRLDLHFRIRKDL